MSGMEVLGAVAAAAQLLGYIHQIAEALCELHDHIRHAPGRIQSYVEQVKILVHTIQYIRENQDYHTVVVETVLKGIAEKVDKLNELIRKSLSRVSRPSPTRYVSIFLERKTEKRVKEGLASLECDKINLLLCISHSTRTAMEDFRAGPSGVGIAKRMTGDTLFDSSPADEAQLVPTAHEQKTKTFAMTVTNTTSQTFSSGVVDPEKTAPSAPSSNGEFHFEDNETSDNFIASLGSGAKKGTWLRNKASRNAFAILGPADEGLVKLLIQNAPNFPCPPGWTRAVDKKN